MTRPLRRLTPAAALVPALIAASPLAPGALAQQPPDAPPAVDALEVTLLDPGAGPHEPLRLRVEAGEGGSIDMIMSMGVQQTLGAATLPTTMIATRYTISTMVTGKTADGDIAYEFEYTDADVIPDAEVPPHILQPMRDALKSMVGLRIKGVVTDRGLGKETSVEAPEDLSPEFIQYLEGIQELFTHMTAPFPVEPIGVGASWRTQRVVDQEGIKISRTAVYTLAASDGDTAEINVEIAETADPQEVRFADQPPDARADLLSFRSSGTGKIALRASRLFPDRASFREVNDRTIDYTMGIQRQQIKKHTESVREIKRQGWETEQEGDGDG